MFPGSPAPLPPDTPLSTVLNLAPAGTLLGVWVRGCRQRVGCRVHGSRALLVGADLGALLRRCDRVVVRDGGRPVALPASLLIRCRVLEIVLGAPFLPPPAQLRSLFPRLRGTGKRIAIPIGLGSAEEALAACAGDRLQVVSTRIVYRG